MEDALIDAARCGELIAVGSCLACCIILLYSITSGTYISTMQKKMAGFASFSPPKSHKSNMFIESGSQRSPSHNRQFGFLNIRHYWLPVCVSEGGGDVGGGRGGRVSGSRRPPPLPPLSPPWREEAAAGTCLVERLG